MTYEKTLNSNFCELTTDEKMAISGGFLAGFLVGVIGGAIIDGILKEETGMGLSGWAQLGYSGAKEEWKKYEATGGAVGLLLDALGW